MPSIVANILSTSLFPVITGSGSPCGGKVFCGQHVGGRLPCRHDRAGGRCDPSVRGAHYVRVLCLYLRLTEAELDYMQSEHSKVWERLLWPAPWKHKELNHTYNLTRGRARNPNYDCLPFAAMAQVCWLRPAGCRSGPRLIGFLLSRSLESRYPCTQQIISLYITRLGFRKHQRVGF